MTREGDTFSVYKNGLVIDQVDVPGLVIGNERPATLNLRGVFDEIALYDRAMTPTEVERHFATSGIPG